MQQLKESIERLGNGDYDEDLTNTAVKFSEFCLRNMKGDLLNRGLAVCSALCSLEDGLKHPECLKD